MFLFFDTETNGLPVRWKAPMTDLNNWPRVIQFGWQMYDQEGNLIVEDINLIRPDGWEIPSIKSLKEKGYTDAQAIKDSAFWRENGYTTENNILNGILMHDALDRFIVHYQKCDYLIAHNMAFDYNIIGAEMYRYKRNAGAKKLARLCTMQASTDFCKIPSKNGLNYKWPKLEELHRILFKEEFDGAHNALADVQATARSFFELVKRGVITLP